MEKFIHIYVSVDLMSDCIKIAEFDLITFPSQSFFITKKRYNKCAYIKSGPTLLYSKRDIHLKKTLTIYPVTS